MRKLFKSSALSFLGNKFAIISLSIIIFLSTATFTLLQSTANSFRNSYDRTVINGNMHDFTVKEKYDVNGSLNFLYQPENDNPANQSIDIQVSYMGATPNAEQPNVPVSSGDYLRYVNSNNPQPFVVVITNPDEYQRAKSIITTPVQPPDTEASNYVRLADLPSVASEVGLQRSTIFNAIFGEKSETFITDVNRISQQVSNVASIPYRNVNSMSITSANGNQYKVVDTLTGNNEIDKTIIYGGNNVQSYQNNATLISRINELRAAVVADPAKYGMAFPGSALEFGPVNITKDFQATMTMSLNIGVIVPQTTLSVQDDSSYQAVVSQGYANEHDLSPIDMAAFNNAYQSYKDGLQGNDILTKYSINSFLAQGNVRARFANNIVDVDNTPYLVTGIGTTPDFSFPIIDSQTPIPNDRNQAIVFTNHNGYRRVEDAFRNNQTENYLAFKFAKGVSATHRAEIFAQVEQKAHEDMSWPSNLQIASWYNDTNGEKVLMAPQRIAFLESLERTISTITYVVIILLSILTGLITIVVVRRQISSKRKTMATLVANGYSKNQVAVSLMSIGFIVGAIPAIIGYITGLSLQYAFIGVFNNYWTLPVNREVFSYISLIVTTIVPIVTIGVLAYIIALWEQRGSTINALYGIEDTASNLLTHFVTNKFRFLHIKNKVSLSLLTTNISRMIVILLASGASIGAASVAITSFGKFEKALNDSQATTNYSYKVNMVSPTDAGGQYALGIWQDPTVVSDTSIYRDPAQQVTQSLMQKWAASNEPHVWTGYQGYKDLGMTSTPFDDNALGSLNTGPMNQSYLQFPNTSDGAFANNWVVAPATGASDTQIADIANGAVYLINKVQTKGLLNGTFGFPPLVSQPWDVASSLMPTNQANYAEQMTAAFYKEMANNPTIASRYANSQWFQDIQSSGAPSTTSITEGGASLDPAYVNFYKDGLDAGLNPYLIAYNQVAADITDETFTSIDGILNARNIRGNGVSDQLEITGINPDSSYVNLSANQYKAMTNNVLPNGPIPVLANKYFEAYYDKKVGDVFNLEVTNTANRYDLKLENQPNPTMAFKIVGEVNSYSGSKLYTMRAVANQALGISTTGFNGVFTKSTKPRVLDSQDLYSPSGLYPAFDTIIGDPQTNGTPANLLFKIFMNLDAVTSAQSAPVSGGTNASTFQNPNTVSELKKIYERAVANAGQNASAEVRASDAVQLFVQTYSGSVFEGLTQNVQWAQMDNYTFENLTTLSSQLVWMVEVLSLFISILFIMVTASMLFEANKRTIATLKVMGYSNAEIKSIIFSVFLPVILLGALLAIPVVFLVLHLMTISIMSFGRILVPFSMTGWEIPVATATITLIFLLVYLISIGKLKNTMMLEAFSVE